MSSRERRDIRRERSTETAVDPDEVDGEEPEGDLTVDQTPVSSLDDLTTPADPGDFTQTFTDDDALLDLQGAFDPTAGPKQVIPRVAYTINFNFVWNADRQRWEPQKKGDPATQARVVASETITVPPGATERGARIPYGEVATDEILYPAIGLNQSLPSTFFNIHNTNRPDSSSGIAYSIDFNDTDDDFGVEVQNNTSISVDLNVAILTAGTV